MTAVLQVHRLVLSYPGGADVIRGIDFEVAAGETLGLVGESGSGKSQTALALVGLSGSAAQCRGSIRLHGRELLGSTARQWNEVRGAKVGFVFQDPMSALNPHLTIGRQITEVLALHRGMGRSAARAEAERWLSAVQMADARRRLSEYPHELSGGMRQRVMIAMALCCSPALLIADEPTTALDVTVQAQILRLLAQLQQELNLALLLITHNFGVVAEVCDRVAVMQEGRIVETGNTGPVLANPSDAYTQRLLAAVPDRLPLGNVAEGS